MARYGGDDKPPEFTPQPVPDQSVNGKPNPAYYRTKWANTIDRNEAWIDQKGRPMPGFDDLLKAIAKEAEMSGFDVKSMADKRTPEQRVFEMVADLLSMGRGILEASSEELDLLEQAMDKADAGVIAEFVAKRDAAERDMVEPLTKPKRQEYERLKKAWLDLIRRARQIQDRAKSPLPQGSEKDLAHAYHAARLLRDMFQLHEG